MGSMVYKRSGDVSLKVTDGQEVHRKSTFKEGHPSLGARWHEISIVRTRRGQFVSAIAFRTTWPTETEHHEARVFDRVEDAIEDVAGFQLERHVNGFPPHMQDRQKRLLRELRAAYDEVVDQIEEAEFGTEEV